MRWNGFHPRDGPSIDALAVIRPTLRYARTICNGECAIVDIRELQAYCLNAQHPRGRNKARVFTSAGIRHGDAEDLRTALLAAAINVEARLGVSKEDLNQIRQIVRQEIAAPIAESEARIMEATRDMQSEILRGLERFARGNFRPHAPSGNLGRRHQ